MSKHHGNKQQIQSVIHTKVPIDLVREEIFVPDELLESKTDADVFLTEEIRMMGVRMYVNHVQPRLVMKESRQKRVQADGKERMGTLYVMEICLGKKPLISNLAGQTVADIDDPEKSLITVGKN